MIETSEKPIIVEEFEDERLPILETRDLRTWFPIRRGLLRRVVGHIKAVDDVNLKLYQGETLGLVGESGCGKSTLAQTLMHLVKPTGGDVLIRPDHETKKLSELKGERLKDLRRHIQMVFQNPYSSMNPRLSVFEVIAEPLRIQGVAKGEELEERVNELLRSVSLRPAHARRFPNSFSGGQRQRIGIARALALRPKIVIADEPVAALDVSVQSAILNLLNRLKNEFGLSYLFISHDLNVVKYMSDRIAVMYLGNIVEEAPADELYLNPLHPYTEALVSAVPHVREAGKHERVVVGGDVPDPANPPRGCRFHTRCPYMQEICRHSVPKLEEISPGHTAACHFARELDLKGGEG